MKVRGWGRDNLGLMILDNDIRGYDNGESSGIMSAFSHCMLNGGVSWCRAWISEFLGVQLMEEFSFLQNGMHPGCAIVQYAYGTLPALLM